MAVVPSKRHPRVLVGTAKNKALVGRAGKRVRIADNPAKHLLCQGRYAYMQTIIPKNPAGTWELSRHAACLDTITRGTLFLAIK